DLLFALERLGARVGLVIASGVGEPVALQFRDLGERLVVLFAKLGLPRGERRTDLLGLGGRPRRTPGLRVGFRADRGLRGRGRAWWWWCSRRWSSPQWSSRRWSSPRWSSRRTSTRSWSRRSPAPWSPWWRSSRVWSSPRWPSPGRSWWWSSMPPAPRRRFSW